MPSRSPYLKFSRWDILFWLYLLLLVVIYGTASNIADADLWHRFALYDYLCQNGHFPAGSAFSYMADYQVVPDHEWGCAFIFAPLYFWGGGTALVLLKLVTLGGTLALTIRAGLGRHSPTILDLFFYSLVILALLSSFLSTLRCEAFTHLFFALWIFWFQLERRGGKISAFAYVLTMVIWANLHGGFVLGLAWLAVLSTLEFFIGGNWKRWAGLLGLCLLATLLNPFGYELWIGVVRALLVSRSAFEEWAPVPWLHPYQTFSGYKLLVLWMIPVLYSYIRRTGWRKCDRVAVILLLLFLASSLLQARQTSLFAVAVGGLLPPLFPSETSWHDLRDAKARWHRLGARGLLFLLPLILALRLLPTNQGLRLAYPPESCPIQAVAYLKSTNAPGRLLVGFNSGSYALWELRGRMLVSMDGRYDLVYSPETFLKVEHFFNGTDDWRKALTEPPPNAVLVNLPDGVYPKMLAEPGWRQVYHDSTQAIFQPSPTSPPIPHP